MEVSRGGAGSWGSQIGDFGLENLGIEWGENIRKFRATADWGRELQGSNIGGMLGNGRPSFWGVTEGTRGEWRRGGVERLVAAGEIRKNFLTQLRGRCSLCDLYPVMNY